MIEQLPHVVCDAIPLIVNDKLYIAVGYDERSGSSTCNLIMASLPEQVLMFYHLKTRRCVNTVPLQAS